MTWSRMSLKGRMWTSQPCRSHNKGSGELQAEFALAWHGIVAVVSPGMPWYATRMLPGVPQDPHGSLRIPMILPWRSGEGPLLLRRAAVDARDDCDLRRVEQQQQGRRGHRVGNHTVQRFIQNTPQPKTNGGPP